MNKPNTPPPWGYILEDWDTVGYRATAHAYMKREGVNYVVHNNGQVYSLQEVEEVMIGFNEELNKIT